MKLRLGNRMLTFSLDKIISDILGMSSLCEDGNHLIFVDYDVTNIDVIIEQVSFVQEKFDLGDAYVFKTSKDNYHLIFLDKLSFNEVLNVYGYLHNYDLDHYLKSYERKNFILRLSKKKSKEINFKLNIESSSPGGIKSNAHRKLLNHFYGLNIEKTKDFDNSDSLVFENYESVKS